MTLTRPEYLWCLAAVPLAALFLAAGASRRHRFLATYPHFAASLWRRRIKAACFLAGLALLALAAAGPGLGTATERVSQQETRLIVALDCSKSMLARDVNPDRLAAAKALVLDVLARRPDLRAGLVTFAGRARLVCPITFDRAAFALFLDAASPADEPLGGTNLTAALEAARLALAESPAQGSAVLLLSDGEETTPLPHGADYLGPPVFTVAVGGPAGATIPNGAGGVLRDAAGNPVRAGVDVAALAELAREAKGAAFRLSPDAPDPAGDIAAELARLAPAHTGETTITRPRDRTGLCLGAGLALLLLDLLLAPAGRAATLSALVLVLGAGPARAATAAAAAVDKGLAAWDHGQPDRALDHFLAARARDPDAPAILFNIGAAYYRLGRFDKAQAAFGRAADTAQGRLRAKALYNQGNAAFRQGDVHKAMALYEAALAIAPDDADAKVNLEFLRSRKEAAQPAQEPDDKGQNGPGQKAPSPDGSNQAQGEGQAPSPVGQDKDGGQDRSQKESSAQALGRMDTDKPGEAKVPVAAREGQKSGLRQAQSAGRADEAWLERIPDLPGLPEPPVYGRPGVEKDW